MFSASEQWGLFQYYLPHKARKRTALLAGRLKKSEYTLPAAAGRTRIQPLATDQQGTAEKLSVYNGASTKEESRETNRGVQRSAFGA